MQLASLWHLLPLGCVISVIAGQLLVAKNYASPHVVQEEPLLVNYDFYNQGEDSILNVELTDSSFAADTFRLPPDAFPVRIPELQPKSLHQHVLSVVPFGLGTFGDAPATVTYERPSRAKDSVDTGGNGGLEKATVLSTGRGLIRIISQLEYNTLIKSHRKEWLVLCLLAAALIGIPYYRYKRAMRSFRLKAN